MPHYGRYESTRTKKSIDKKNRAKEKSSNQKNDVSNFVISNSDDYGIVVEVKYNDAYVFYDNKIVYAHLSKDVKSICNQIIFPGDKVVLKISSNEYVIENLISRTTLLSRVKKDGTRLDDSFGLTKNIAANINLAVIVVSAKEPPLHPKFIDRYLMIIQNSNIEPIICLNKSDLKTEYEDKILDIYRRLNIVVIETSAKENSGIEKLKECLRGKQAIFVGNSGVGKSSLTNMLLTDDDIKTSSVSEKSKRGRHTTTSSKYYVWDDNSSVIDTPGIRSLDVSSFSINEIQNYFKEFDKYREYCKYNDCLHYNEPYESCKVKQALESNLIDKNRYESYIRIIESLNEDKKRNI